MKHSNSIKSELVVVRKEFVTPHYISVFFESRQFDELSQATIGIHSKIMIPPKGTRKIVFPEYDYLNSCWKSQPDNENYIIRTYTLRAIDMNKREIRIDFVSHGDEGPASAWAISAKEGDVLGVTMRSGIIELCPVVANYVLVGDATAIPVLSVILNNLSKAAKGICIIEVHGPEDQQQIFTEADIEFIWLYNPKPSLGSDLATRMKSIILPEDSHFAYIAAEFSTVKEIRHYLRKEKLWGRDEVDAYSYWKKGVSEDNSADERHNENATNTDGNI